MDKLSVVITCYKPGEKLAEAFASLRAQTDNDFEIIIVNDASPSEDLNQACRQLETDEAVGVIWRRKNGGAAAARNDGCRAIAGNIYIPLDADDVLPPDAVATIRHTFDEWPAADFVFGDYLYRPDGGAEKVMNAGAMCGSDGWLRPQSLAKRFGIYGGSPFRKIAWERVSGYDESVPSGHEDVDFWLRMVNSGARGRYVNHLLYIWQRSERGMGSLVPKAKKMRIKWVKNAPFYDRYAHPIGWRKKVIREALKESDYGLAVRLFFGLILSKLKLREKV
ncbi:MAG: glycosyltransferase family A protein [Candidatus Omnitrophota bacterium]|nr:glycosyltransferase family A protein [Candidatus Omnitrophota bacterium]